MGTEKGNENFVRPEDTTKEQIRCLVSNIYDLQKLRIAAGNRIVQSFYTSLGIKPSEKKVIKDSGDGKEDKEEKERKKTLMKLRSEYKRVSDYVAENKSTIKSAIKTLKNAEKDGLQWIRNDADYQLIDSYNHLLMAEERETKVLDSYVVQHPMWERFFKDIKGCGTLMSAVCIAYFDPYKARHVSSFYKYCGIDAVKDTDEDGNVLYWGDDRTKGKLREKYIYEDEFGTQFSKSEVKSTGEYDAEGNELFVSNETGETCIKQPVMRTVDGEDARVYEYVESGEEYVGDVTVSEHGRRKGDTEMYEYTDKNGEVKLKRGITYNPALKTKLVGVLSGCLLKAKDPTYSPIFYNYKERLEKSEFHRQKNGMHKLRMAERYMIKQFVRNLWVTWREYEGLPVDNPYEVEKLGHEPHALNRYQCEVARRSKGAAVLYEGNQEG